MRINTKKCRAITKGKQCTNTPDLQWGTLCSNHLMPMIVIDRIS